jgi:hypothetical protein
MNQVVRKPCPVCQGDVPVSFVEDWREFKIWACRECELQFADPLVYSPEMYSAGYGDPESQLAKDTRFYTHVDYGAMLSRLWNVLPFVTPLERSALRWITSHVATGSPTMDIGCGCGRFLMALKQSGYEPYGIDVASPPVKMLQEAGFRVALGTLEAIPSSWPRPRLVSCFEVLEHVPNPVGFLASIRERFPDAPLVLSVPLPVHERCDKMPDYIAEADYPPNHLTRWTRKSLSAVFEKAGYRADIRKVHVTGDELPYQLHLGVGLGRMFHSLRQGSAEKGARNGGDGNKTEGKGANGHPAANLDDTTLRAWSHAGTSRDLQRYYLYPYTLWLRLRGKSGYAFLVVARSRETGSTIG